MAAPGASTGPEDFPARRADRLYIAVLAALLLLLTAASWHRWANIVVDAGLAMNQPLRLLHGERLYSGVYQLYGPLPPYICAWLYKLFGVSLNTLYATGFTCAALALALYYWLARRLLAPTAAALASLLFLGLCEFKLSGNYIFPYTYAADFAFVLNLAGLACLAQFLHSRRRQWVLAAGVAAGLALACKIEIGGALAVAAGTVLLLQQPRRGRARLWFADLAALVVPALAILAAAYAWALQYASGKQVVLDSYLLLYNLPEPLRFYNRWRAGLDHPLGSLLDMALAVVVCALIALLFLLVMRPRRTRPLLIGVAACLALLAAGALLHRHPWQSPLRASPLLVILLPLWLWRRARPLQPRHWLLIAFCVDGLISMGRVILRVPSGGVAGSFVIPVVLLLWVWVMIELLPPLAPRHAGAAPLAPWAKSARKAAKFTPWRPAPGKQRGADSTGLGLEGSPARSSVKRVEWRSHSGSRANQTPRMLQLVQGVLALAAVVTVAGIGMRYRRMNVVPLTTARGAVDLPPQQAAAFQTALQFIAAHTRPDEPILALPAGSALNFFTNRPDPLRWDVLIPGYLTPADERDAIARLQATHTRYIFLMNRPTDENGATAFGRDYYPTLGGWIQQHYRLLQVIGPYPPGSDPAIGPGPFFIKIYNAR